MHDKVDVLIIGSGAMSAYKEQTYCGIALSYRV